jgi:hypothetical protein
MVDFTPPFGENGERRLPDATEQSLGLSCDPQQLRELLNGMFNLHQGQIKAIADEAGVTPNESGDKTLLNRAVLALIAAATGAGDTSEFVLFTQARARLPIFPDVQNVDGRIIVTAPATGTVRVPGGVSFLHRGIFLVTTAQTDFPTDPSKAYHLRWNPTDGFVLRDLASGTYNPSTLAETNVAFDSAFDDMLVARVITNSSNVATITNLSNKNVLEGDQTQNGSATINTGNFSADYSHTFTLNWSRTPFVSVEAVVEQVSSNVYVDGWANKITSRTVTRYNAALTANTNFHLSPQSPTGTIRILARR